MFLILTVVLLGFGDCALSGAADHRSGSGYQWGPKMDHVNLVGLGRNNREDIIRPCALDDRSCIRMFLARNSKCKPAYGPVSDPLYMKSDSVYFPAANMSGVRTKLSVTGLSRMKFSEFYLNKNTGNLVIALDFQNLNETSLEFYYKYHRKGKESIVLSDYATTVQRSGTFTAVIPGMPHLRLDLAEIHVFTNDFPPRFYLGPRATASTDPAVSASLAAFYENLATVVQEFYLISSQVFTTVYIQEALCDFGLIMNH